MVSLKFLTLFSTQFVMWLFYLTSPLDGLGGISGGVDPCWGKGCRGVDYKWGGSTLPIPLPFLHISRLYCKKRNKLTCWYFLEGLLSYNTNYFRGFFLGGVFTPIVKVNVVCASNTGNIYLHTYTQTHTNTHTHIYTHTHTHPSLQSQVIHSKY